MESPTKTSLHLIGLVTVSKWFTSFRTIFIVSRRLVNVERQVSPHEQIKFTCNCIASHNMTNGKGRFLVYTLGIQKRKMLELAQYALRHGFRHGHQKDWN